MPEPRKAQISPRYWVSFFIINEAIHLHEYHMLNSLINDEFRSNCRISRNITEHCVFNSH